MVPSTSCCWCSWSPNRNLLFIWCHCDLGCYCIYAPDFAIINWGIKVEETEMALGGVQAAVVNLTASIACATCELNWCPEIMAVLQWVIKFSLWGWKCGGSLSRKCLSYETVVRALFVHALCVAFFSFADAFPFQSGLGSNSCLIRG